MILIRPVRPEEEEAVVAISIAGWRQAYSGILDPDTLEHLCPKQRLEGRKKWLFQPNRYSYVALWGEKIVGFCDFGMSRHESYGAGEIYALYISRDFPRQGIGERLVTAAKEKLCELNLTPIVVLTFKDNQPARCFYEKLGFQESGIIQSQIGRGIYEEVVYVLHL
ncbi:MAG: GNAT family N-acetyltransferase [Holosporales bacterium]|jgi:ribosomal protein S18 acetylase RimI-like enzyme